VSRHFCEVRVARDCPPCGQPAVGKSRPPEFYAEVYSGPNSIWMCEIHFYIAEKNLWCSGFSQRAGIKRV